MCLDRLLKEENLLRLEKSLTESDLDALNIPLSIVTECISMRDSRVSGELTLDTANVELKRELSIVENSIKLLSDQCQRAWEQLNRLSEIKSKLKAELLHKSEARNVDDQQHMINKDSTNVTFKTDAMRNPKKFSRIHDFLVSSENNFFLFNLDHAHTKDGCTIPSKSKMLQKTK